MKASQSNLPSLLSAITFSLGAVFLFGIALLMGVAALTSVFTKAGIKAEQTILLVAFGFEGLVLLAAAFFSFQKFLQKPSADQNLSISIPHWLTAVFIIAAGGSILVGYLIGRAKAMEWFFLPLLTLPAIVLPLAALLAFGTKQLPFGTRSQTWSILGLAMTLGPLVLFTLEIFVAIVILSAAVVYVMTQPELLSQFQGLAQQFGTLNPDSEAALDLLAPLLMKPAVMVIVLIYMAVLVPAVEEIFKPIGVWLFAGTLESQAQGFALGALSGAGYALIETIGVSAQSADWASLLFSRIGTGLLHVTTSALMGGAIVLVWRERRYARLIGTYLLAVLLHGLWNSLAILFTFSNLAQLLGQAGRLSTIQPATTIAMVILAIGLSVILVTSNRKMQKTISPPPAQTEIPDEGISAEGGN
ncbi:MAG TPA: PrsW family glutamic-type intramembrane protease [Anaerolineales bacterium]|nr:PrsW family glutamic-type intramembrane protease [Anaerolineales bacterium]